MEYMTMFGFRPQGDGTIKWVVETASQKFCAIMEVDQVDQLRCVTWQKAALGGAEALGAEYLDVLDERIKSFHVTRQEDNINLFVLQATNGLGEKLEARLKVMQLDELWAVAGNMVMRYPTTSRLEVSYYGLRD